MGLKFRRQFPIHGFVADFCCYERRLLVELDGPVHDQQQERDQERDHILRSLGYEVLRFPNARARDDLDSVLEAIAAAAGMAYRSEGRFGCPER
jgi:very-short-patch-repair endonuclease